MLDICVAGWYLDEYDDFYMNLHRLSKTYNVFVVSNKDSHYLDTIDLLHVTRENTGLEWGAYNYYLMNIWDGESDVLFCHDDIEMNPTVVDGEVIEPEYLIDKIAACGVDQGYIFGSRQEDVENHGQHGRMVYCSAKLLRLIKELGGFWYDQQNKGYVTGDDAHLREKYGCHGYNAGIIAFHDQVKGTGCNIHRKIYIPSFSLAKRGQRGSQVAHYGQWMDRVGKIIEQPGKKLHVGCGNNYWDTHTNVDLISEKADINADAADLPIKDSSYTLIESHHLIEHLSRKKGMKALQEWYRVLKSGGHVFLSCPDINAAMDLEDSEQKMHVLYGTDEPGMAHLYGYTRSTLEQALKAAGFKDVSVKTAIGNRPTPSLLAIGKKYEHTA